MLRPRQDAPSGVRRTKARPSYRLKNSRSSVPQRSWKSFRAPTGDTQATSSMPSVAMYSKSTQSAYRACRMFQPPKLS
jgi:hypothetical protein